MVNSVHPWQTTPASIINHAIQHLREGTGFDDYMAFLLFDVGVETILKTFLGAPTEVSHTDMPFNQRQKVLAEKSFHRLVQGVEEAASSRLDDVNLDHVRHYHDIRNKLYHSGNGVTVPHESVVSYAEVAVALLACLLEVDLREVLHQDEIRLRQALAEERHRSKLKATLTAETDPLCRRARELLGRTRESLELVAECVIPQVLLPSFRRQYDGIYERYTETWYDKHLDDDVIRFTLDPERRREFAEEVAELLKPILDESPFRQILELESFGRCAFGAGWRRSLTSVLHNQRSPIVDDLWWKAAELVCLRSEGTWIEERDRAQAAIFSYSSFGDWFGHELSWYQHHQQELELAAANLGAIGEIALDWLAEEREN